MLYLFKRFITIYIILYLYLSFKKDLKSIVIYYYKRIKTNKGCKSLNI
jgi:hypothetical protein